MENQPAANHAAQVASAFYELEEKFLFDVLDAPPIFNPVTEAEFEDDFVLLYDVAYDIKQDDPLKQKYVGSVPGRKKSIARRAHPCSWVDDYLAPEPIYGPSLFAKCFGVPVPIFERIFADVGHHFVSKPNCFGDPPLDPRLRVLSALRWLTEDISARHMDDMARISASKLLEDRNLFCDVVVDYYWPLLFQRPDDERLDGLLKEFESLGWPGCVGSVDVMHLEWKNCPKMLEGQYRNKDKYNSICIQAVVGPDLDPWDIDIGRPGSNNDITVMEGYVY
eukprot:Colp12_sorted_trinity150504_noHs@21358